MTVLNRPLLELLHPFHVVSHSLRRLFAEGKNVVPLLDQYPIMGNLLLCRAQPRQPDVGISPLSASAARRERGDSLPSRCRGVLRLLRSGR